MDSVLCRLGLRTNIERHSRFRSSGKPATPRLNGKVERSHRIDQEEFYRMLEGVVIDDTELFNDRLRGRATRHAYPRLPTTTAPAEVSSPDRG